MVELYRLLVSMLVVVLFIGSTALYKSERELVKILYY